MATIEKGIIEAILANSLLSAQFSGKITSVFSPLQSATSSDFWCVMTRISNVRESAHDGDQNLSRMRYQFTLGSKDKSKVDTARDLLIRYLNATEYVMASTSQILTFFHEDDHEEWDEGSRIYTSIVDFMVIAND